MNGGDVQIRKISRCIPRRNLLLLCVTALLCVLCILYLLNSKKATIKLPFAASDVEDIELYRFKVPTSAEQKIVTSEDDIERILNMLTNIAVEKNEMEPIAGSTATSFRFNLTDGTDLEIIYVTYGVKAGEIKSSYLFDYQTSADVGAIWDNYGENHRNVGEYDLPTYEK